MSPLELDHEALSVLDSMHQHIVLLDTEGIIVAANSAWTEFGRCNGAKNEAIGSIGLNYFEAGIGSDGQPTDACAAAAHAGIRAVLASREAKFELEYPCHGPDEEHWFLMRVVPLVGHRRGAVVSHEDITASRLLGQQRDALIAELQIANRELNEFAYVVSHDLKAPLRGISSLANWLVADHADRIGPEGASQLVLIASRVKRLSGLIDAILAYSRAGRRQVERTPVPLEALVRNTIDLLAPPPHIHIEIVDALPQLTVQAVKLQQVFQNLLSNAIDFIDKPQGHVVVGCKRGPEGWHFTVTDNGPGIESRHFERIFQLFQTLNSRDDLERTGVGLAMVKKIVELEGGRLWLESTIGVGTTFHFILPAPEAVKP